MHQTNTTFSEVCQHLALRARNHHDHTICVRDMQFDNLNSVQIGPDHYPVNDTASRQIASRLNIPYSYLAKCPEELQAHNLNTWLDKQPNRELLVRFDAHRIRAILTPRYKPTDHIMIVKELTRLGVSHDAQVEFAIDNEMMLLNVPDPASEFAVNGKDRMQPGISVNNSEVGLASLSISAYIYRLVCSNGLISAQKTHARSYRHVSEHLLEHIPQALENARSDTSLLKDQLTISLNSPVDDPQQTFETLNRQFQLGSKEQDAVQWAWPFEAGETLFHIIQTYTRASQHKDLGAEEAYRLQKTGGQILELIHDDQEWPHAA